MSQESVWAGGAGRRRVALSLERIVAAAIAVADADGLGAVSIRRVAADLGAKAMSLYTYIDRKDDLLGLMADEVAGGTVEAGELPADWREATLALARRERETARLHPWVVDVVSRRPKSVRMGPNMLRHAEQSVAALAGLDAPAAQKRRLLTAVADYSIGYAVREGGRREGDAELLRRLVSAGDFPHLVAMLDAGPGDGDDFEYGLRCLLNGFAR